MASHFRTDRVGMEIKREVNEILQKKVRDPRVQGVTITDVQMLGDLSMAKVYYSIMSDLASDNQKAQTGLEMCIRDRDKTRKKTVDIPYNLVSKARLAVKL